jgi:dihydrofolate reductase
MRKCKLFIACSLDGFIAGPNEEIDWLMDDADYGFTNFFDRVDTVVMGRKSYDLSLSFPKYPYPGKTAYVLSRSRTGSDQHARFVNAPVSELMRELRGQSGKDIWLIGGGQVVGAFLAAGEIDWMSVAVHPLVLGAGIPLFPPGTPRTRFKLEGVQSHPSGLVQLEYSLTR